MIDFLLFILGLVFLIKGADWLVDGASQIAARFKIPEIVVGLTIVAFGTSAPELIVNIIASAAGNSEIAVGNVLGSNVANILLILGTGAIMSPLVVARSTARFELPFSLGALALTAILAHNAFFGDGTRIGRADGLLLLLAFGGFCYYALRLSQSSLSVVPPKSAPSKKLSVQILMIIAGISGLFLGGKWVVDGAVSIARMMSISEGLIAITLVAIGTSLPELATSVSAARKDKSDIVTGNAIGSNIFNLLWVLGLSAVISPIRYQKSSDFDIFANFAAGILMIGCLLLGRRLVLTRLKGLVFLAAYAVYIGISIWLRSGTTS